jgi:hypothetical protein
MTVDVWLRSSLRGKAISVGTTREWGKGPACGGQPFQSFLPVMPHGAVRLTGLSCFAQGKLHRLER